MYNKNLKEKFFAPSSGETPTLLLQNEFSLLFNVSERYEAEARVDLYDLDFSEVKKIKKEFREQGSVFIGSDRTDSMFLQYLQWCQRNNVEVSPDSGLIVYCQKAAENYSRKHVSTPKNLRRALDQCFDFENEETLDNVYRAYYWLAYMGIRSQKSLEQITCDDVDLERKIVKCEGAEYPIYKEAMPSIRKCKELSTFNYKHPEYSQVSRRERCAGDKLLCRYKTDAEIKMMGEMLRGGFTRNRTKIMFGRTYSAVNRSGGMYKIYMAKRAGADESAVINEIIRNTGDKGDVRSRARRIEYEYRSEYRLWLEAFKDELK